MLNPSSRKNPSRHHTQKLKESKRALLTGSRLVIVGLLTSAAVLPALSTASPALAAPAIWRAPVSATDSLFQPCGTVAVFVAGETGNSALGHIVSGAQESLGEGHDVRVVQLNDVLASADALVGALAGGASTAESDGALAAWKSAAEAWAVAMNDAYARCGESVVVVGFGEHAAAAEYALSELSPASTIGGIALVASPLRSLEDPSGFAGTVTGDAGSGDGLAELMAQAGLTTQTPILPDAIREHVIDGCVSLDYVCDSSSVRAARPDLSEWLTEPTIVSSHGGYGTVDSVLDGPALEKLGSTIAARLDSLEDPLSVAVEVPQYLTETIDLEPLVGAGNGMEQWRLLGAFPASVYATLSSFGSLIVSPEVPGRFDVALEHRQPGGAWVQAHLELTVVGAPPPDPGESRPAYPPIASTNAGQQECADFLVIGARGSGQTSTESAGYGGEVAAIRDGIIDGMASDLTVREVWLDYAAAPVPLPPTRDNVRDFFNSIRDGTDELIRLFTAERKRCGDSGERWIVAGYSQGALAARKALSSIEVATDDLAQLILVADPGRRPIEDGIQNVGSGDSNDVGALVGSGIAILDIGVALPASIKDRTIHVCDAWDVVCDASPGSAEMGGFAVHSSYTTRYAWSYGLGKEVADRVGGTGYSPADDNQLLTGSIKRVIDATPFLVARGDGQEALWIRCNSEPERCAIMSSIRAAGTVVWSPPIEIAEIANKSVNLNAITTQEDRTVVTWAVPEPDTTSFLWFPNGQQVNMNQIKSIIRVGNTWSAPVAVTTNRSRDYQVRLSTGADGSVALVALSQGSCLSIHSFLCSTSSTDDPRLFRVEVSTSTSGSSTFGPLNRVTPAETAIWGLQEAVLDNGSVAVGWEPSSDRRIHVGIFGQSGATVSGTVLPNVLAGFGESVLVGGLKSIVADGDQARVLTSTTVQAPFSSYKQNAISTLSQSGELSVETLPNTVSADFRAFDLSTRDILLRHSSFSGGGVSGSYLESAVMGAPGSTQQWSPLSRHAEGVPGFSDIPMIGAALNFEGDLGVVAYHGTSPTSLPTFDLHVLATGADIWSQPRTLPFSWRPGDGANASAVSAGSDGIASVMMVRSPLTGSTQYFMQSFVPNLLPRTPRPVIVSLSSPTAGTIVAGQTVTILASVASSPARQGGGAGVVGYYELYSDATLLATSNETSAGASFSVPVPQGGVNSFTAVWHPIDDTHVQLGISGPLELSAQRLTPSMSSNAEPPGGTGAPTQLSAAVSGALSVPTGTVTVTLTPDSGAPVILNAVALEGGGSAVIGVPSLPLATYTVEIAYSGDRTYVPRTIAGSPFTVSSASDPFPTLAGAGSDTTQDVVAGVATLDPTNIGSWDAVSTGPANITTKSGGPAFKRPNGSGDGVFALGQSAQGLLYNGVDITGQLDFARSSSPPSGSFVGTDLTFIPFARDAVSYAVSTASDFPRDIALGSAAQDSISPAVFSLRNIYRGTVTTYVDSNLDPVTIRPIIPQQGSGTRSFWLTSLGLTEANIVGTPTTDLGNTAQEHNGTYITGAGDIAPFSVAQYIAQGNHGALPTTIVERRGNIELGRVGTIKPIILTPGGGVELNTSFPINRTVYNVVQTSRLGETAIANTFVGPTSTFCSTAGQNIVRSYGFAVAPNCGVTTITGAYRTSP